MKIKKAFFCALAILLLAASVQAQTSRSDPPLPQAPSSGFEPTACQQGVTEGCAARGGGFFTDQTAFIDAINPGFYQESFDGVVGGAVTSLDFTDGTYSYTITAFGGGSNELFNDPGLISTDSALDALLVSFTGAPVFAVGGIFYAGDINFAPTGTSIVLTLDDGTEETLDPTAVDTFAGFVSASPILSIAIEAPDGAAPFWPTIEDLIVGTVVQELPESVPVPTMTAYGLIALALIMLALGVVLNNKRRARS